MYVCLHVLYSKIAIINLYVLLYVKNIMYFIVQIKIVRIISMSLCV